ncbi:hypothetical protein BKA64DRAFT_684789 [Cadophora sp. MPI-SDFR-AT-0126]|nr:hypothetical protein BKA64DRAFT_684789 [Leotiomycetes sp. MPI-SDFR-AT-0126]
MNVHITAKHLSLRLLICFFRALLFCVGFALGSRESTLHTSLLEPPTLSALLIQLFLGSLPLIILSYMIKGYISQTT